MIGYTIGFVVGSLVNAVWRTYFRKGDLGKVFEHYHWAEVFAILGKVSSCDVLYGLALALLLDEAYAQRHPFALRSGHFLASTVIGLVLLVPLIVLFW